MKQTDNLTHVFDAKTERNIARTYPGQAHFGGSGPAGKSCRACVFWEYAGHHAVRSAHDGKLKPGRCHKFKAMTNRAGPPVPHTAEACRFFEEENGWETRRPLRQKT